jgi:hypothetical protein
LRAVSFRIVPSCGVIYVAFRVLQKSSGNASNVNENVLSRNESTFHVLAGVNVPSRFCFKFPSLCDHPDRIPFRTRTSPPARTLALTPSTPPWHSFCPLKGPQCLLGPFHPFSSTQPHARSLPGLPSQKAASDPPSTSASRIIMKPSNRSTRNDSRNATASGDPI